jgi:hypothetical protein
MAEVEIDYAAVSSASERVGTAGVNVATLLGYLEGDSTGVENPAQRASLRLAVHSKLSQLRDAAANRSEAAGSISRTLDSIHTGYRTLDTTMASEDAP